MSFHRLFRALPLTGGLLLVFVVGPQVHAAYTLIGWHAESIGPGPYSSLAVDPMGRPHVAYYDVLTNGLKYAVRNVTGWHVMETDAGYSSGVGPSLALDSEGYAHISHTHGSYLTYTYQDIAGWHTEGVLDVPAGNGGLVLDDQDRVHLAYLLGDDHGGQIIHAVREGGVWRTEPVFSCPPGLYDGCDNLEIDLDPADRPHIAFSLDDPTSLRLMHAAWDGSGWAIEPASEPLDVWDVEDLSLAMDGGGQPHISYSGYRGERELGYAYRDAAGWHIEAVADNGLWNDLAVSASGVPHIAYFDLGRLDARYAYRDSAGWHMQTLEEVGWAGYHPSIALLGGYPAFTYYHAGAQLLRYVFQTPIDIQPGEVPNLIDPSATDKVSIIVMSAAGFDARTIDPLSATFGPGGARPAGGHYYFKDADLDGDVDLGLAFRIADAGIPCGATTAVLEARTNNGQTLVGWDEIRTTNCGD